MANSSFTLSAAGLGVCVKYFYDSYLTDKETEAGSGKQGIWSCCLCGPVGTLISRMACYGSPEDAAEVRLGEPGALGHSG